MSHIELEELYSRISRIKTPKVAYLDAGSTDKDTRKWAKLSNRPVFNASTERWQKNTMFNDDLDKWEQVQVNTDELLNAVIFDVDEPSLFMYPDDGAPYSVVSNKTNNNFHTTYLLNKPFYAKSDKQKSVLDNEVRPQIKRLAQSLGADGNYTNVTTKNPFNERLFTTNAIQKTIPDVWYLLNQFSGELKKLEVFEDEAKKDSHYLSPMFKEVIGLLVEHSKQNIRLLTVGKDEEQFRANMAVYAAQLVVDNAKQSTINSITKDVIDRALYLADDFCSLQQFRSKKAHLARYGNQVQDNQDKITDAILLLVSKGLKPTMTNIAPLANLSLGSLKNNYSKHIKSIKQRIQC